MTADALPGRPGAHARHRRPSRPSRPSRQPSRQPGHRDGRPLARVAARLVACIAFAALAVLCYQKTTQIRSLEAWLAGHVVALGAATQAGHEAIGALVWFALGPARQHQYLSLQITPECTVALLLIPFLLATACLVWLKGPLRRPLRAVVTAVIMLIAVNQLRILTIVWFIEAMGDRSGYYWGHTVIGSLITVFGVGLTLVVYAFLAITRGKPRRIQ